MVGSTNEQVLAGSRLFYAKGCQYCHTIAAGVGGIRGPDLTYIGDQLTSNEITWRIANGGVNMPSFAGTLTHDEINLLVQFLLSRKKSDVEPPGSTTQSQFDAPTDGAQGGDRTP